MAKLMKQYSANTGMVHRGQNGVSPFYAIQDALIVKNSLSSRAGYASLGALPRDIDIFEMVEIQGDFYEILVTTAKQLYVFKNGTKVINTLLRAYTGGSLSFSNLGNVIAIWDKAQTVAMVAPPEETNPHAGFIVVTKSVDYNTSIVLNTPAGEIKVTVGDPTVTSYSTVDATRGVDAIARAIARGGSETYSSPAEALRAAYTWANDIWNGSGASTLIKSAAWPFFEIHAAAYDVAAAAYNNLDFRTAGQRAADNAYWLDQAADIDTEIRSMDLSVNANYNPVLDYTMLVNANLLATSTEKTALLNKISDRTNYEALAAAALVALDNTAIIASYTTSIQNIVDFLTQLSTTWWIGYMHHGDWAQVKLSTGMVPYLEAAKKFLVLGSTRDHKGNVVYFSDLTGITIKEGEEYLTLIDGKVLNPLELPRYAPLGAVLRIEPIPGKGPATFAKASPKRTISESGVLKDITWEECADITEPYEWDQATMPTLVDLVPSIRVWNEAGESSPYWREKRAGDIELCPNPFLVGNKIVDISRGANRLLLLGSNASLTISELGKRNNLFRVSTLLLYPTDAFSTIISGEKPANLYKIAHWGSHIAILGSTNLFKFDLSNSIDATFPKMTRGVGWNGKEALVAATEADLLLIGEAMYSLSYGSYGVRVELTSASDAVNLPQNLIKALYDPIRKNAYLIAPDTIWVAHLVKENWAWTFLTVPGTITNAWMETQYLRLSCTKDGLGTIVRMPLYPGLTQEPETLNQFEDTIVWRGTWAAADIIGTQTTAAVGARAGLTLTGAEPIAETNPVLPVLALYGSEVPGVGRARITRCLLRTVGDVQVCFDKRLYFSEKLRSQTTLSPGNREIVLPANFAGALETHNITLLAGEISGVTLEYIQGKANLGSAI